MNREFDEAKPELMDRAQSVNPQLRRALEDLAWLNRVMGSRRALWQGARPLFRPGESLRFLDLATGGADIPRYLVDRARALNCQVMVDAVDFHPATAELARSFCAGYPEITIHQGDARSWSPTLADPAIGPYDLVLCSLALHHFSEADATMILRQMAQLAGVHGAMLVLDLERSPLNAFLIELLTRTLIRNPMTVADARTSIRRAFTARELRKMADEAGWTDYRLRRVFPTRLILHRPASRGSQTR